MSESSIIEASGLVKAFESHGSSGGMIPILGGAVLDVRPGERVAIQGESGVGKTTLLNILGGLDRPDHGTLLHRGSPVPQGQAARARWRRKSVGFIFQFHGLLSDLTALENVALAGLISGWSRRDAFGRSEQLLGKLGLMGRIAHYPEELSGGEQQRVATARALLHGPSLVLADEPTGNLDPETGAQVFDLLMRQQEETGFALIVATHSSKLAARCHRILRLVGGVLKPSREGL